MRFPMIPALLLAALLAMVCAPAPAAGQVCGNGAVEAGEACDDGPANGTTECGCSVSCDFPFLSSPCGNQSDTACDNPDTCDGLGVCLPNYEFAGTPCGDDSDTECDDPDSCGAGVCLPNPDPICEVPALPSLAKLLLAAALAGATTLRLRRVS
jgi:hypothetical protein